MRRTITGFSNPTVKHLRALREKKHRKAAGKFLAEGLRLLTDARECGHLPEMLVMASGRDPHPLLDALEAEVQTRLEADPQLNGNAVSLTYDGDRPYLNDAPAPGGGIVLMYTVQYRRERANPAVNY